MPTRNLFIAVRILPQTSVDSSIRAGAGVHRGVEKMARCYQKNKRDAAAGYRN
jgi:hypothetical protein